MHVRPTAKAPFKTKPSNAHKTCKCGLKARDVVWILHPCGCEIETTCTRCTRSTASVTLTSEDGQLKHHCGHTAPAPAWHVVREPVIAGGLA
jgi:hypothetical protein